MKILMTNSRLDMRAGADMAVSGLARELQGRGHTVMAYTSDLYYGERFLQTDLIPACTDLGQLPLRPDVIHAYHHLDAMTALLALPGVPVLFHAPGPAAWELHPRHPRIFRYLATSPIVAERIEGADGIARDHIRIVPEMVDTHRVCHVRTPKRQVKKALFYNDCHLPESAVFEPVRQVCEKMGVTMDRAGMFHHPPLHVPEKELPRYDLVFTSGRFALEALACGCAVVLLSLDSCGPLLGPENFAHFRDQAFFVPEPERQPLDARVIEAEIGKYDPARTAALTQQVRAEHNPGRFAEDVEGDYRDIRELAETTSGDRDYAAEFQAVTDYMLALVPKTWESRHGKKIGLIRHAGLDRLHAVRAELENLQNMVFQEYGDG